MKTKQKSKSVKTHLLELGYTFILPALVLIIAFITFYVNIVAVMEVLVDQASLYGFSVITLAAQEVLMEELKSSLLLASFVALPFITIGIVLYIADASTHKARIRLVLLAIMACVAFVCGVVLSYKIMLPIVFTFLYQVANSIGKVHTYISVENYIGFMSQVVLVIGSLFEMPIVVYIMSSFGLVTFKHMKRLQVFIVPVALVFGALFTPPDVMSQLLMAVPIMVLFFISEAVCYFVERRKTNGNFK